DSEEINKNVWNNIESNLNNPKKTAVLKIHRTWLSAAAAIIVTVLVIAAILRMILPKTENVNPSGNPPSTDIVGVADSGYNYQMKEFVHLIEIKQTELKEESQKHPELYKQFINDINSLDSSLTTL